MDSRDWRWRGCRHKEGMEEKWVFQQSWAYHDIQYIQSKAGFLHPNEWLQLEKFTQCAAPNARFATSLYRSSSPSHPA